MGGRLGGWVIAETALKGEEGGYVGGVADLVGFECRSSDVSFGRREISSFS